MTLSPILTKKILELMKLPSKPTTKHHVMQIYEAMIEESISPLALQQSNKYTMTLHSTKK